jgi:phenylacetic acid degradation operon negative regulatory protein
VYSGSVIDVFERAGVGEQATRSTLTRMVKRDLLRRQREGRRMYFGLTEHSTAVLRDGERRIWQTGAVNRDWDGTWTLLGFSLPESWQRQRHDLRSKLTWSGFGPLFSGLWLAPGEVDVSELVSELGLSAHVKVFRAHADAGTDIGAMIEETWDLSELGAGYQEFVRRWQPWETVAAAPEDALARRLVLQAEWLRIIRRSSTCPTTGRRSRRRRRSGRCTTSSHRPPGTPRRAFSTWCRSAPIRRRSGTGSAGPRPAWCRPRSRWCRRR